MELRQYFSVFWKWLWMIVLSTLVAAGAAYYATSQQPKTYQASATLIVGQSFQNINPNPGDLSTSTQLAQTYVQILKTDAVLQGAIDETGIRMSPESLGERVSASLIPGTQLIELRVTDTDPQRTQVLANELAHQLTLQGPAAQAREVEQQRAFLQGQIDELRGKIQDAQGSIESLQQAVQVSTSARDIQDKQDQIDSLQGQINTWRDSFSNLLGLLSPRTPNYVSVLDPAKVPTTPIGPNIGLNVLLAGLIGFILSTAMAFLFEYLDDTIKSSDDVERSLNLTTVGLIAPISNKKASRLVTLSEPRSLITEAYRVLRTNIQFAGLDKPISKILITSAGPTEGKSVTAANLSIVMAQAGFKTVLIDGDLRKPSQHRLFEVANDFGLTNCLLSHANPDGFLRQTRVEGLKLLTTGALPPNPAEILGSASMQALLDKLGSDYQVIVIDSPPILPVADAAILTRHTDGVLLVIDANRTRPDAPRRAINVITNAGGRIIGVVLNRVNPRGGGYAYYYRQYYAQNEKGKSSRDDVGTEQSGTPARRAGLFSRR